MTQKSTKQQSVNKDVYADLINNREELKKSDFYNAINQNQPIAIHMTKNEKDVAPCMMFELLEQINPSHQPYFNVTYFSSEADIAKFALRDTKGKFGNAHRIAISDYFVDEFEDKLPYMLYPQNDNGIDLPYYPTSYDVPLEVAKDIYDFAKDCDSQYIIKTRRITNPDTEINLERIINDLYKQKSPSKDQLTKTIREFIASNF